MATRNTRSTNTTRSPKERVAATSRHNANAAPQHEDVEAEAKFVEPDGPAKARQEAWERFRAAQADLSAAFDVPSGSRVLLAYVTSFVASFGVGYLGGLIISMLTDLAVAATGFQFIGWIVLLLGVLLAVYASVAAGSFVFEVVSTDKVTRSISAARSWVTGLFAAKPIVAATE
jgi:hypothetical protein